MCVATHVRANSLLNKPLFATPSLQRCVLAKDSIWISPWDEFELYHNIDLEAPHLVWHSMDVSTGKRAWAFSVGPRQAGARLRAAGTALRAVEVFYVQARVLVFTHTKYCTGCGLVDNFVVVS